MNGRLREWFEAVGDIFWIRPAIVVLACIALGEAAVTMERSGRRLAWLPEEWIYAGGEAGARALLGAVATSTISVAGTTFSITVAALSLASAQMGPRLLRSFVRDSGNQLALGIFLGTFAYALVVLRTVRSVAEQAFVPHVAVTGALVLAMLCVATLVWFVHHVASGINVQTVIDLVHEELSSAIRRLGHEAPEATTDTAPPAGRPVVQSACGYLRAVDEAALAEWAQSAKAVLVLLVRPGDYLFPGAPVAEVTGKADHAAAEAAIRDAFTIGARQAATQDPEFAVRQLVEVAVRALSPGVNDPFTAIAVIDRLGATLCEIAPRHLPGSTVAHCDQVVLHRRVTDYAGLCDMMFNLIRQNAEGSPAVLIRLLETLGRVLAVEGRPDRRMELLRHADLIAAAGRRTIGDAPDLAELEARRAALPPRP